MCCKRFYIFSVNNKNKKFPTLEVKYPRKYPGKAYLMLSMVFILAPLFSSGNHWAVVALLEDFVYNYEIVIGRIREEFTGSEFTNFTSFARASKLDPLFSSII